MINNKAILFIWPSHNYFKHVIEFELINNKYNICEYKSIKIKSNYVKNCLREIHFGKKWWELNLENEYLKRITNETEYQTLTYFIIKKQNIHKIIKQFKKQIREKYNIDKSYFHICDPDCQKHLGIQCNCPTNQKEFLKEFNIHLDMITNKNTIHFLNNSNYQKNYKFNQYLTVYKNILNTNSINDDFFCIDNGGILAAYGLRDTHDLDFLNLYNDDIKLGNIDNFIGCENKNHREEYKRLGLTIKDIILKKENHFIHFGVKFMALSILKKFKYNRTKTIGIGHKQIRQKDIDDYEKIKKI